MGARSSKPPAPRVEPKGADVELFQGDVVQIHQEERILDVTRPVGDGASDDKHALVTEEKPKKRQRSKKQSSQESQQQFEHPQDACALVQKTIKTPSPSNGRSKFFNIKSWRVLPQLSTDKSGTKAVTLPAAPIRSQSSEVLRSQLGDCVEDLKISQDLNGVELLSLAPVERSNSLMTPTTTVTPIFMLANDKVESNRAHFQATPPFRVETSERLAFKQKSRSQSSELCLVDVDEDLMRE